MVDRHLVIKTWGAGSRRVFLRMLERLSVRERVQKIAMQARSILRDQRELAEEALWVLDQLQAKGLGASKIDGCSELQVCLLRGEALAVVRPRMGVNYLVGVADRFPHVAWRARLTAAKAIVECDMGDLVGTARAWSLDQCVAVGASNSERFQLVAVGAVLAWRAGDAEAARQGKRRCREAIHNVANDIRVRLELDRFSSQMWLKVLDEIE